jgi:hypothetical protein
MLVKPVFGTFAHKVTKPETMRLSPSANRRLKGFQPGARKMSKNLQRLRYRRVQSAANRMACGAKPTGGKMSVVEELSRHSPEVCQR